MLMGENEVDEEDEVVVEKHQLMWRRLGTALTQMHNAFWQATLTLKNLLKKQEVDKDKVEHQVVDAQSKVLLATQKAELSTRARRLASTGTSCPACFTLDRKSVN